MTNPERKGKIRPASAKKGRKPKSTREEEKGDRKRRKNPLLLSWQKKVADRVGRRATGKRGEEPAVFTHGKSKRTPQSLRQPRKFA